MHVLAPPDRLELAHALAGSLAEPLGPGSTVEFERKVFPDGERFVRVPVPVDGVVAVLVDTFANDLVVEALIACDAAREAGADAVHLCIPYLAYARQDRAFNPGEGVSARALCRALASGADGLVTVDVHTPSVIERFDGPAANVLPAEEIAAALAERGVDLVLAPDAGARERARDVADRLDCPFDHLEKTRESPTVVHMAPKDMEVDGATVAIVDDIISTGGTMATATGHLLDAGAARVLVTATHGLFVGGADKRLEDAGASEVLVTDTVPTPRSAISCAPALARGLVATVLGAEP